MKLNKTFVSKFFMFSGLVLCLGFGECHQVTILAVNGALPPAAIPFAKPILGTYTVTPAAIWADPAGTITLQQDPQFPNRIVATSNFDILGDGCQSHIGNLLSVFVFNPKKPTSTLGEATFAIDPGHCPFAMGANKVFGIHFEDGKANVLTYVTQDPAYRTKAESKYFSLKR